MKKLINVKEFFGILDANDNVVVLDCRFSLMDKSYGVNEYKKGHIKGAYLIDIETDLTDEISKHGGRHPFKDVEKLKNILENFGISNDTIVVAYDDGDLQGSGRLIYQLRNIGIKNSAVLDGGIVAYKNANGEIETTENIATEKGNINIELDNSLIVDMNYVKSKLYNNNVILVDSRSNPRYLGLEEPVDKVAGHIPSAKNYFFKDVLSESIVDSSFKDEKFLEKHFSTLNREKEIIVYCGSGISLMVNTLALEKIGIPYKYYPGSYSDWISYEENEIKTGEE